MYLVLSTRFDSFCTGTLSFTQLTLQAEAEISHTHHLHLLTANVILHYNTLIEADNITLETGSLHLEGSARLDTSGRGANISNSWGPGGLDNKLYGTGGGHGGFGGSSLHNDSGKSIVYFYAILRLPL